MEHARKMILVPADKNSEATDSNNQQLQQQYLLSRDLEKTVQTPGTPTSRLDAQMLDILKSDEFPDLNAKSNAYQQALQRFLTAKANSRVNQNLEIEKLQHEVDEQEASRNFDDEIINTVPVKYREKARSFLMFARKVNSLTWDDAGRVRVRGLLLPDSNIVDLVNDAMRSRKRIRAKGRSQFCSALRAAGLPEDFVGNKDFWRDGVVVAPHNSFLASPQQQYRSPVPQSVSTPIRNNSNNRSKTIVSENETAYTDALAEEEEEDYATPRKNRKKKKNLQKNSSVISFRPEANSSLRTWNHL